MTDNEYDLGNEVKIKIIGVFMRNDGDHKFIAVEENRDINDFNELSKNEIDALTKLFPNVGVGEGWFGKEIAIQTYENCEKAL